MNLQQLNGQWIGNIVIKDMEKLIELQAKMEHEHDGKRLTVLCRAFVNWNLSAI